MRHPLKTLVIFLLILTFFYPFRNQNKTFAQESEWKKYPQVVLEGTPNNWDEQIHTAAVLYKDGKFLMWYGGWNNEEQKGRIGFAESDNGVKWEKNKNFVLDVDNETDEYQINCPVVIFDQGKFKMWFRSASSFSLDKIGYAESDNGKEWYRYPINFESTDTWTIGNRAPGSVLKIGDSYYLWYTAVDNKNGVWRAGVATSPDGKNWIPNSESISSLDYGHVNHPSVVKKDNNYYFWFHDKNSKNIDYSVSNDPYGPIIPNLAIEGNKTTQYDSQSINKPYAIELNGIFHIWYSAQDNSGKWSIAYVTNGELPQPSTPSIVIIPGMFASWNSAAILEGEHPPQDEWKMNPLVNDYERIIETLEKAGYSNSASDPKQNLFIFNYDWRKLVKDSASDLDNFIKEKVLVKNPNQKVYLIGHSLGGLIGRTYIQNYPLNPVDQLITLGTPHSGSLQAYKAWEGGVIDNDNPWEKLAFEIILGLNRKGFRTNKDTIREIAPVTHDLLPTFNYLIGINQKPISVNSMVQKNDWLDDLETNFNLIYYKFYSIYGETAQTPEQYQIEKANLLDSLLGLWQDGKPIKTIFTPFGDETVLSKSATRSADEAFLLNGVNHRNLVSDKDSLSEIMNYLNIKADEVITTTPLQPILPALFVAIGSPAKFSVTGPNGKFSSNEDGFILIPSLVNTNYQIEVEGTNEGRYHLNIGEITNNQSTWVELDNSTTLGKTDQYAIFYSPLNNSDNLLIDNDGLVHLTNAVEKITELKEKYPHWISALTLRFAQNAKNEYQQQKFKQSTVSIKSTLKNLSMFRKKNSTAAITGSTFDISYDLISAYDKIAPRAKLGLNKTKLKLEITKITVKKEALYNKLKIKGNEKSAQLFNFATHLLDEANQKYQEGDLYGTEIRLFLAESLFSEI